MRIWILLILTWFAFGAPISASAEDKNSTAPDYARDVLPIFRKYCTGCHNADDREGKLSLESYADLLKGGQHGAVLTAGQGSASRLVRLMLGQAQPVMPPDGNEAPKPEEIALVRGWIDGGAKGPQGKEPDPTMLITPRIEPTASVPQAIHALAVSPNGRLAAVASYAEVILGPVSGKGMQQALAGIRGPVSDLAFSHDGRMLVAAAGEPGLFGEARLWQTSDGKLLKVFQGHRDCLMAVALRPQADLLATASYDKTIKLWDVASGRELKTLTGHNEAVYDVAFSPDGKTLASASGDRTIKLWDIATGERLDTFSEPLKEQFAVAFHPDGSQLAAAGADGRIRLWEISPSRQEGTNTLLQSRFVHEGTIQRLVYSPDGNTLVSSADDRLIKVFSGREVTPRAILSKQSDWATGLAIAPDGRRLLVGRIDGTRGSYPLPQFLPGEEGPALNALDDFVPVMDYGPQPAIDKLPQVAEVEPNHLPNQATSLPSPGVARGRIAATGEGEAADVDLYSISAQSGEQWIIEIDAARSGSQLDSKIEVLAADGKPVERLLLRAVRDSEVTFRSIDSNTQDCRVTNWQEMQLNQLMYLGGEVTKIYRMPQGPDSGFGFYPGIGSRRFAYFDTTSRTHALFEPCYVIVPYAPGTDLPDNGLPVFRLNYENDDDSRRELGKDSRLSFIAPADGKYLIRVSDVRGGSGEKFQYRLIVRRPEPDFSVELSGVNPVINAGSGKTFTLDLVRKDNYNGPVQIEVSGLPPGYSTTSPLVIEAGHIQAKGAIYAAPDAAEPTEEQLAQIKITATAQIASREVTHEVTGLGKLKMAPAPKVIVHLEPDEAQPAGRTTSAADIPEVMISPGTTVTCKLRVDRAGFDDRIQFDVNNLPHGVIVDNIGLNGVLIPEGKSERTLYLTAASWVPETERLFHATAKVDGNQSSLPMRLRVVRPQAVVSGGNAR